MPSLSTRVADLAVAAMAGAATAAAPALDPSHFIPPLFPQQPSALLPDLRPTAIGSGLFTVLTRT